MQVIRIKISDDDLEYAEKRPITTEKARFIYNHQTESSLSKEEFYEEGLYSGATESAVGRLLGVQRKLVDDTSPDLPGDVEVTTCAAKYWAGRPYIVSRVVRQFPRTHRFYGTLVGFRVPNETRIIELRYFLEPQMAPFKYYRVFGRTTGKQIHRWLVEPHSAREKNAHIDVWSRLQHAVRQRNPRHVLIVSPPAVTEDDMAPILTP